MASENEYTLVAALERIATLEATVQQQQQTIETLQQAQAQAQLLLPPPPPLNPILPAPNNNNEISDDEFLELLLERQDNMPSHVKNLQIALGSVALVQHDVLRSIPNPRLEGPVAPAFWNRAERMRYRSVLAIGKVTECLMKGLVALRTVANAAVQEEPVQQVPIACWNEPEWVAKQMEGAIEDMGEELGVAVDVGVGEVIV